VHDGGAPRRPSVGVCGPRATRRQGFSAHGGKFPLKKKKKDIFERALHMWGTKEVAFDSDIDMPRWACGNLRMRTLFPFCLCHSPHIYVHVLFWICVFKHVILGVSYSSPHVHVCLHITHVGGEQRLCTGTLF